jgi:hypothetical protein
MAQETRVQSRFDPLSVAWRLFAAPQTLLVLLGLVSVALGLAILLPQIPAQAATEPQAWLAVTVGGLGPAGDLFLALGLFDILHSLWFRLLLALIGLSLFVRAVDSAELAWYTTGRRPWPPAPPSFWGGHPLESRLESSLDLEEIQARLETLLTSLGYRWIELPSSPVSTVVAVRRGVVLWARPIGYVALLLSLVGLAIVATWSWQGAEWQPVPGENQDVAQGTPYKVRLDAFDLILGDDQRLQNYSSQITWLEAGSEVQQDTLELGRASSRKGATVRQVGFVPVVRLRGWDQQGQLLALETAEDALSLMGEVEIRFASAEAQPLVLVPAHDLFLAMTFEPVCARGTPALYLTPVQAGTAEPGTQEVLYDSGSINVGDLRFEVELFYVPILRADYRPGMGLVVSGLVLFVLCLSILWIASPRLAWLLTEPGPEDTATLLVRVWPDAESSRWLRHLTRRFEEALSDDG